MKKIIQFLLVKSIGLYLNFLSYLNLEKAFAIAYKLFSNPRKGKINLTAIPETLDKADKETNDYEQHQFQTYIWKGNDELILLVHGWESNASRWKKFLPYLKKTGKTIIAIDAPAHGLTSGKEFNVPIYCEIIHQVVLKYNPKIIIGHSIGGNAIAYYQFHYKHNFEKIILLGAPSDFKIILNNYFKMLNLNSRIQQKFITYIKERFTISIEDFSASKFLKDASISGIIAHDENDKVVLFEEGIKLSNSWKRAKFIATKGLGHSMHDADLYQTIIDFIVKDVV